MFFEDREVIYQEESPGGRWRLTVYAPIAEAEETGPTPQEELYESGATFFAEFEKVKGIIAVGFPFGGTERGAELTVDWSLPGKVCGLSLDGDLYLLFKWGICFIKPRELNRIAADGPIAEAEAQAFFETALRENKE